MPSGLASYLAEPARTDPPVRVWRDWALVAVSSTSAVLEFALRTDRSYTAVPLGWRIAEVIAFFAVVPYSLLVRRAHPLRAMTLGFTVILLLQFALWLSEDSTTGLMAPSILLTTIYSLYRWGSGRHGAIGGGVLVGVAVIGNINGAERVGDVIGGVIVLALPVLLGLTVRYRRSARERAIAEAQARERAALARELHDTVAHHVSAIAVQAQAGRSIAAQDPQRAVAVLAVIEEAASRTLEEMRALVDVLRAGGGDDRAPQHGIADLDGLARSAGALAVHLGVHPELGDVSPAVGAAVYRIAQESVTNAVRHAREARRVDIRLTPWGGGIRLEITDDGEATGGGGAAAGGEGYGLRGMAERVQLLGGTFAAGPLPGRGWRVTAELPRGGRR